MKINELALGTCPLRARKEGAPSVVPIDSN
jgi:hypothetical protein